MNVATLIIPLPPSLNNIFFNRPHGGRAKTTAYKNWRDAAAWDVAAQKPGIFKGDVTVDITIERPNKSSDLDNRLKAVFDLLQYAGVIKNDNSVSELHARWGDVSGARVILCEVA